MGRNQELLDAARNGDKRTVEKILGQITKRSGPFTSLRRGAGVNAQDDNGYTALHHACLHGHKEIVRLLLSVDASPCIVDKKGATPLHLAAWKGDSNVVAMLLAHNNPPVDIDHLTSDHETALLIAAHFGYVDVVAQLMAKGADVTVRNNKKESALDLAAHYGRVKTVQHLLCVMPQLVDPYKLPKSRGKMFDSTPLHRASKNGCKDVVLSLLEAGIDPNIRTPNGTALHEAACFGRTSVVRVLLSHGADLNVTDKRGKTVNDLLAEYKSDATRKVRRIIREFENQTRMTYESEEDLPPFPVTDYSPSYPSAGIVKAPETQENTNTNNNSFISLSSSYQLTKNPSQSFVQKLASKCLGLKAKFSSAPNISNNANSDPEVDVKSKNSDQKNSTNTLLIGNSKFFKRLSKKESSGDIVCNDEFDTISLDRLSTINRDTVVNRSNRSCPGFKNSLPNISENNELSDESIAESIVIIEIDSDNTNANTKPKEAVNLNVNSVITKTNKRLSGTSNESASYVNECYEAYEFSDKENLSHVNIPVPPPRPNAHARNICDEDIIYENISTLNKHNRHPTPAIRTNLPMKISLNEANETKLYENISLISEQNQHIFSERIDSPYYSNSKDRVTPSHSRSSTLSSDSMIDESNLEDILLSEKSKSFKHNKNIVGTYKKSKISESSSISSESIDYESDSSDVTEVSAIENVDCSEENRNNICVSIGGTLPQKNTKSLDKKKPLFRHKTFTNIDIDRNSVRGNNLQSRNNELLKETLAHYHIRGTGHCIYNAPTVSEFIEIFNRDTLYRNASPFTKLPTNKRDSYYETAICFCRPKPPKHHNSAEDLLELYPQDKTEIVSIDYDALKLNLEVKSTSFRCYCDSGQCVFHADKRTIENFTVKFSVVNKSISTPNISLDISPSLTMQTTSLDQNQLVAGKLEEPYAIVNVVKQPERYDVTNKNTIDNGCFMSTLPSTPSTLSSDRPYSLKDIDDAISLNSTSTASGQNRAFNFNRIPLRQSSSEHSGHWSLQSCESNATVNSDISFATCIEESSEEDSDDSSHSDGDISEAETVKSDLSTSKKPWVHSDSFKFNSRDVKSVTKIIEEEGIADSSSNFESGINVEYSESSSSECGDDSGVPRVEADVSLVASLERGSGVVAGVRSGSGRRRWEETEGTSEGDALSVSSAASSCAPLHLAHHQEYSKVSPTPPKKPPRRNLSVSPTHANSPSSGYSYELRPHARSQDDLDDIQGAKHYLKHGRSVDQYVDGKLSYSEYEDNHNSPRLAPVPNPRPSLKHRSQPVAITATYENVVIKEQNPRRKLRRNNFAPQYENFEPRMNDGRVRKYSNQEKSSLESLLDDQSMNSPSDCERYYDGPRIEIPSSPSHYEQPPTPDHPPPSARQAENSIHERIRPLSQLIMEVVEEIRIRKKSQGDDLGKS